jgi:hypothetical protein
VKHPNFDSHAYHLVLLSICVEEFIGKGGEYGHKVGRTLANRVDERRNMINDNLSGGACIESVRGSVDFELFLLFS